MRCPLLLPICPFAKATEGQIVSWGSWAGSNTDKLQNAWAIERFFKTNNYAYLDSKGVMAWKDENSLQYFNSMLNLDPP